MWRKFFNNNFEGDKNLAIVGGVAANKKIRSELQQVAFQNDFKYFTE